MSAAIMTKRSTVPSSGTVTRLPVRERFSNQTDSASLEVDYSQMFAEALSAVDLGKSIENAVSRVLIENYFMGFRADDPFDAVYISELEMDTIVGADVLLLKQYAATKDLSQDIDFPEFE